MQTVSTPSRRALFGTAAGGAAAALLAAAPASATTAAPVRTGSTTGIAGTVGGLTARRPAMPSDATVAAQVKAEFLHGWRGYTSTAWGYDEVRPVSRTRHDFFAPGHTFGLSIVEAVDTLHLMGEDAEVTRCCDWIDAHLDPAANAEVQVFEAVIRLVGGLLAAHLASGRPSLLARARELADRLLPAYTSSPTGIPYTHVNLRSGAVRGAQTALAEAGTSMMEFGLLSRLTGDPRYYDASLRAYRAVISRRSSLDLLGTTIHAETGRWVDVADNAPNPPVDSFYEYLWGGGALLGDRQLTDWYHLLTGAVLRRQSVTSGGHLWFHQVDFRTGRHTGAPQQSELASFFAGLLGKGGDLRHGAAYHRSWTAVLDRYPTLPETVDFSTMTAVDRGSQLRPEYANSAFDLWRLTGGAVYKQTAYRWFEAMRTRQRVPGGYTVAGDVTVRGMRLGDLTPAYWFAENLKYLWLIFSRTSRFDYRSGLLSTEGKVLSGIRPD
ncbi:glycoside hydrolase family 47 protein [Streptacidiphilus sp. EB129]|uniref:glycoside hydrolase family 47 protein n=1 Tax=Streptacidiphilus sp. EB129 TaxID=3156262 RepID=UPI0035191D90